MSKIKICGLSQPESIECVNEVLPDYAGFMFFEKSKRYVTPEKAALLLKKLSPKIRSVGVFVNSPIEEIAEILRICPVDLIQLHGSENEEFIKLVSSTFKKEVIKAFSVKTVQDIEMARLCAADFVLLDNGAGGTGEKFDWSLLEMMDRPYFLAGGLNPENVAGALTLCSPFAVDVSSGVETNGRKDNEKIKSFISIVRDIK